MHRDAPMATLTKNDGILSLQHCQEWSFSNFLLEILPTYCMLHTCIFLYTKKLHQKYQCESQIKCVAYTFEQSKFNCVLHSSTNKGLTQTRGKQTGTKKTDYTLSLPEMSLCSEQNRQKRCKREPKCQHVDCNRNV